MTHAAMMEKQGAGEHGSESAPSLPGPGNLPKSHKKGAFELHLEKRLELIRQKKALQENRKDCAVAKTLGKPATFVQNG